MRKSEKREMIVFAIVILASAGAAIALVGQKNSTAPNSTGQ